MNTWSFPNGVENKNETDPLIFTHKEISKNNIDKINQEENTNTDNKNTNIYKDLKFEGLRTNEVRNYSTNKEISNEVNHINNQNNDINNEIENNDDDNPEDQYMEGGGLYDYEYEHGKEDDYYYISEIIPPQNFPAKLRNIKVKYNKLKEDIEKLKKEIKKYNPNYVFGKNTKNNIP